MKFYEKNLAQIKKTASDEKNAIKNVTKQFLTRHDNFSIVW